MYKGGGSHSIKGRNEVWLSYGEMKSAGQTSKATYSVIKVQDSFDSSKLLRFDVRNVSLFVLFRV